ncbi:MAG: Co2+/Mg2+ efflux protein ApaG [Bergeyella sp.]
MVSRITNSVKITVLTEYDAKNSFPSENRFVFRYTITIENLREDSIRLLKRKWLIYDVGFGFTEVSGDGVIGLTPEIKPGEHFSYFSHVVLHSGVGNMSGNYLFRNTLTEENFEAVIPKFNLHSGVLSN